MTQTDLSTSAFWKDSLKTTNNVITEIAKSTSNIQNIEMILRQSRLDNSIGHIKSNCVLCCLKCNKSNKSEKKAALMRQLNLFELNDSS